TAAQLPRRLKRRAGKKNGRSMSGLFLSAQFAAGGSCFDSRTLSRPGLLSAAGARTEHSRTLESEDLVEQCIPHRLAALRLHVRQPEQRIALVLAEAGIADDGGKRFGGLRSIELREREDRLAAHVGIVVRDENGVHVR